MVTPRDRQVRIIQILNTVRVKDEFAESVDKGVLEAEMSSMYGTSHRTFLEYLNVLINNRDIVVDGNNIWLYERWHKIQNVKKLDFQNGEGGDDDGSRQSELSSSADAEDVGRPADSAGSGHRDSEGALDKSNQERAADDHAGGSTTQGA